MSFYTLKRRCVDACPTNKSMFKNMLLTLPLSYLNVQDIKGFKIDCLGYAYIRERIKLAYCIAKVMSIKDPITLNERSINVTQYPLPSTHYPVPITQYPLPSSHYPVPITQFWECSLLAGCVETSHMFFVS